MGVNGGFVLAVASIAQGNEADGSFITSLKMEPRQFSEVQQSQISFDVQFHYERIHKYHVLTWEQLSTS